MTAENAKLREVNEAGPDLEAEMYFDEGSLAEWLLEPVIEVIAEVSWALPEDAGYSWSASSGAVYLVGCEGRFWVVTTDSEGSREKFEVEATDTTEAVQKFAKGYGNPGETITVYNTEASAKH